MCKRMFRMFPAMEVSSMSRPVTSEIVLIEAGMILKDNIRFSCSLSLCNNLKIMAFLKQVKLMQYLDMNSKINVYLYFSQLSNVKTTLKHICSIGPT